MCPPNSEKIVAIDSQSITYFVEAERNAKPVSLRLQKEYDAVYEIALTYGFWLLPKVYEEVQKIPDLAKRFKHDQSLIQLFRHTNLEQFHCQIETRTKQLLDLHSDEDDCRILAEAEALSADVLLTVDGKFQKRLKVCARTTLVKPSELAIPVGTRHKFRMEN